jgi:hypothetical protein
VQPNDTVEVLKKKAYAQVQGHVPNKLSIFYGEKAVEGNQKLSELGVKEGDKFQFHALMDIGVFD